MISPKVKLAPSILSADFARLGEQVREATEAGDSVFGQILRYIGWVHRNLENARNNVRGIIVASKFPETARYSRIGLLKDDYSRFLKFKEYQV